MFGRLHIEELELQKRFDDGTKVSLESQASRAERTLPDALRCSSE